MENQKKIEKYIETFLIKGAGLFTLALLLLIILFILKEGLPFVINYSMNDFLLGIKWYPLSEIFGVIPLITGSLLVTFIAILFALPMSLATALFISEITPKKIQPLLKISLEILSSIPSVVFGFLGIIFLGPLIKDIFNLQTSLNAFTAGILLAFMAIPTIASVAEESLQAVPNSLREASLALGASKLQTMIQITLPTAFSGIFAGIMLGIGRAIGETMTVMMVAGGAAQITANFFEPVRTMTGTIASEMGEVIYGDIHYQSLFMIALILFIITLMINTISGRIVTKIRNKQGY